MEWAIIISLWIAGFIFPPLLLAAAVYTLLKIFEKGATNMDNNTDLLTNKETNESRPAGQIAIWFVFILGFLFCIALLYGFSEMQYNYVGR